MLVGGNIIPAKHLQLSFNDERLSSRSLSRHTTHSEAASLRNILREYPKSTKYHTKNSSRPRRPVSAFGSRGIEPDLSSERSFTFYPTISHFKFSVPEDLTQTLKIRRSRYEAFRERLNSQHIRNYIAVLEKSLDYSKNYPRKYHDYLKRKKTAQSFLTLINQTLAKTTASSALNPLTDISKIRNFIKNFILNSYYLPLMMLVLDFYRRNNYISNDILRKHYHQQLMPYNFTHCPLCVLESHGLLQEYAKDQEQKHRRKIILPCVIPWEYGSNKFASQKGTGGFGAIRNASKYLLSVSRLFVSLSICNVTCLCEP